MVSFVYFFEKFRKLVKRGRKLRKMEENLRNFQ